jgi:hypothetical protein
MALTAEQELWNLALGKIGEQEVTETGTSEKQYIYCNRFYSIARDEVMIGHLWNEAMSRTILLEDTTEPIFGYDARYSVPSDYLRIVSVDNSTGAERRNNFSGVFPWEVQGQYILADAGESPQTWAVTTNYNANEYVSTTPVTYSAGSSYIDGQYVKSGTLVYEVLVDYTASSISADITAGNLGAGKVATTGSYLVANTYTSSSSILTDITAGNLTPAGADAKIVFVTYVTKLTDTTKFSPRLKDAIVTKLAIKIITGLTNDTKGKIDLINEFERIVMPQARSVDAMQGTPKAVIGSSEWIRSRTQGTYYA